MSFYSLVQEKISRFSKSKQEFIRFVFVGVIATILHYSIYLLLLYLLNGIEIDERLCENISNITGYVLSCFVNFYLTSYFTFGVVPSIKKGIGFGGAHAINLLLHTSLLNLFLYLDIPKEYAPLPVFPIAVIVNFFLLRFVFHSKRF